MHPSRGFRHHLLVRRVVAAILLLATLSGCTWVRHGGRQPFSDPDWALKETRRLGADELWKEHDGGDQVYIQRGCVSETLSDYRHRRRPWTIRCSLFDQGKPAGARSLFAYYHNAIENEIKGIQPLGDETYVWKSPDMRSWIVGFCRGKYFVEISLGEEGDPNVPMSDQARAALLDFARRLAIALP